MTELLRIENVQMDPSREICQNELLPEGTSHIGRAWVLLGQTAHYVRNRGVGAAIWRVLTFAAAKAVGPAKVEPKQAVKAPVAFREVLDLQPGEWVEVKSLEEIEATLDEKSGLRGLTFTPEMEEYCGKRLRVFKRVQRICMESKPHEMRSLTNTVILEGSICNGGSRSCDRSCFFFWREAWLRRAN